MKLFLFRISRLFSVIIFGLTLLLNIVLITQLITTNNTATIIGGIFGVLLMNAFILIFPIIFNWLVFGKLTLWISKDQI